MGLLCGGSLRREYLSFAGATSCGTFKENQADREIDLINLRELQKIKAVFKARNEDPKKKVAESRGVGSNWKARERGRCPSSATGSSISFPLTGHVK